MGTLQELREELRKERVKTQAKKEIESIGRERMKLARQIKEERTKRKYGKYVKAAKTLSKASQRFKVFATKLAAKQEKERRRRNK